MSVPISKPKLTKRGLSAVESDTGNITVMTAATTTALLAILDGIEVPALVVRSDGRGAPDTGLDLPVIHSVPLVRSVEKSDFCIWHENRPGVHPIRVAPLFIGSSTPRTSARGSLLIGVGSRAVSLNAKVAPPSVLLELKRGYFENA